MKYLDKKILILVMVAIMAISQVSCATVTIESQGDSTSTGLTKDLVVLYTNDVHGNIDGGKGYAGVAALKKEYEAAGNHVLLIDAGDAIQGAAIGTISKGEYLVNIMNEVGYDLASPGNHEFDFGMERFLSLTKKSDFPYISSNFVGLHDNKPVLDPYKIFDFDGVKIAFIGAITPKTVSTSTPLFFKDDNDNFVYGFCQDSTGKLFYDEIQNNVDEVRAQGAQYVFILAHLGIEDSVSPWMSTQLISNTSGIDAVIDGHSHTDDACIRMKNKDGEWVMITQTGTQLNNIGMLLLTKEGNMSTGFATPTSTDEQVTIFIDNIKKEYEKELNKTIGRSDVFLTLSDPLTGVRAIRNAQTNLGDFCADAYRITTGADISLVNGGGIRQEILKGDITYGDIINVHPFDNQISVVKATGQQILDALEHSARMVPEELGGFLQVSGIELTINTTIPSSVKLDINGMFVSVEGARRVQDVKISGQPIELAKTYTVAGNNFLLKNDGDGFTMFKDCEFEIEDFMLDNQTLMTYIEKDLGGIIPVQYEDVYGGKRITLK